MDDEQKRHILFISSFNYHFLNITWPAYTIYQQLSTLWKHSVKVINKFNYKKAGLIKKNHDTGALTQRKLKVGTYLNNKQVEKKQHAATIKTSNRCVHWYTKNTAGAYLDNILLHNLQSRMYHQLHNPLDKGMEYCHHLLHILWFY